MRRERRSTPALRVALILALAPACANDATSTDLLPAPALPPATSYSFPTGISANARYLIDDEGRPFFLHGEAAWSMLVQLSPEDIERYLEDRRRRGVNAVIVNLIESTYANSPPANAQGNVPFSKPGDFTTPDEAYFADIDRALSTAAEKGIVFLLNPAYMGFLGRNVDARTDGWWVELEENGPDAARWYGRWLGRRYRNFRNIIWVAGGDRMPPPDEEGTRSFLALMEGIKEEAPNHLWTAHWANNPERFREPAPQSLDVEQFRPYLDLNGIYTYENRGGFVHEHMLAAYKRPDHRPTFLWESHYEGPNHHGFVTPREMLRRQAYEAVVNGGTGHVSGSMYIWSFGFPVVGNPPYDWRRNLDSPGTRDMQRVFALVTGRPWHELVPDTARELVIAGSGQIGTASFISAAMTPDGSLGFVYIPSAGTAPRTFTISLTHFRGPVTARWYNPADGSYSPVDGSPFSGGERTITTPGDNGTGTSDWVLVLEANGSA